MDPGFDLEPSSSVGKGVLGSPDFTLALPFPEPILSGEGDTSHSSSHIATQTYPHHILSEESISIEHLLEDICHHSPV